MTWEQLEVAAPELARLGRERLDAIGLAFLGTLRRDGSPRISPVEPFFADGQLVFGVMTRSGKARDLARDPRCALQSVVAAPNAGEGELKLYGRAVPAGDDLRAAVADAWWLARPAADADVYALEVDEAVFVTWDLRAGLMTLRRWSPGRGPTEITRSYPWLGICAVHVDDVVQGLLLACERGRTGEAYLLAGERTTLGGAVRGRRGGRHGRPPRSVPAVLVRLAVPFGPLLAPFGMPSNLREAIRASHGVTLWASDEKARAELGFAPRGLERGLADLAAAPPT